MNVTKWESSVSTYFQAEWKLDIQTIAFKECKFIQACGTTIVNPAGLQARWSRGFLLVTVAKIGDPDKWMSSCLGGTLNHFFLFPWFLFCFVLLKVQYDRQQSWFTGHVENLSQFLKFVSHDVSQGERYYIISVKCEVIERKEK